VEVGETIRVESAGKWREWLASHHADRGEIWLVNDRKGLAHRTLDYEAALDEATCFGWVDGLVRRLDDTHYLVRWTPRRPRSNWTPGNCERARRLFSASRMTPAGLAALPPELRAELGANPLDKL
jgi:uncharacterized protein YdeI (YjbR/CyaY-like superfamily)